MAVRADGSHGALMDDVYRRQRHFYDFTRRYYLIGRDDLIRKLNLLPGGSAVEIGCGTARNLIAIARRYPGVRLFGIDASGEMLRTATRAVARAGLSDRIVLIRGFAESLSPGMFGENRPFDCTIFSYSLSMIPDWLGAMTAAGAMLSDRGRMHILDFGDFGRLGRVGAGLLRLWLKQFHVTPRGQLLQALEKTYSAPDSDLEIYPGRYAFHWSASRIPENTLTNVAATPQTPEIS